MDGTAFGMWKKRARRLRMQTYALYLAHKDPRGPRYAKALAACVVAYAFSLIDLIPDPIPVMGYLDALVLIPLGVVLVIRMTPSSVMAECQEEARKAMEEGSRSDSCHLARSRRCGCGAGNPDSEGVKSVAPLHNR